MKAIVKKTYNNSFVTIKEGDVYNYRKEIKHNIYTRDGYIVYKDTDEKYFFYDHEDFKKYFYTEQQYNRIEKLKKLNNYAY